MYGEGNNDLDHFFSEFGLVVGFFSSFELEWLFREVAGLERVSCVRFSSIFDVVGFSPGSGFSSDLVVVVEFSDFFSFCFIVLALSRVQSSGQV